MDSSYKHPRNTFIYGSAMLVSLVGLVDAIYLTVHHLTGESVRCTISGGCSAVLGSAYAAVNGIPIAALGAIAYFLAFSLATLSVFGYDRARGFFLLLTIPMLLATLRLFYLQAFVLHAFCDFCLLSAGMTVALTVLAFFGWRKRR